MPGAKWSYCVSDRPGNGIIVNYAYIRDTVIDLINWQIIEKIEKSNKSIPVLITRWSNDSVYHIVNDKKYLLFSYNVKKDDEYVIFRSGGSGIIGLPTDSACSSKMNLKVINKSEVVLNTFTLNSWDIQDLDFNVLYNYSEPMVYTLIERLGVINNFHFINPNEFNGTCSLISEIIEFKLIEYSDNNFYYKSTDECLGVGLSDDINEIPVIIYPNPTKGILQIDCPLSSQLINITIYSQLGQIILQKRVDQNSLNIDLMNFPDGLYFINIEHQKNELTYFKTFKIIKNEK